MIDDPVKLQAHAKIVRFVSVLTGQLDDEDLLDCVHEDHRLYQNVVPRNPLIGVRGIHDLMRSYLESFADWQLDATDIFLDGTTGGGRITCRAVHQQPLGVIRATGRAVHISAIGMWWFRGERIEQTRLFVSGLAVLQQLGALELHDPRLASLRQQPG